MWPPTHMKCQHGTKYTTCCLAQAQKIQNDNYKPDIIVGIARGGLVPSRILADLLETKDFAIITIEYYVGIGQKNKEPVLKAMPPHAATKQKSAAGR